MSSARRVLFISSKVECFELLFGGEHMTRTRVLLVAASLCLSCNAGLAQSSTGPPSTGPTSTPPPVVQQPPPVVTTPPPVVQEPPRTPPPVVVIPTPPPQQPFINPMMVPQDYVFPIPSSIANQVPLVSMPEALSGLSQVNEFPSVDALKGPADFILVQGDGANFKRETPYLVNLAEGTVLASVKRPSELGMLSTPLGAISLSANSDAFISFENGLLRVRNIDALGQTLRVMLDKGPFLGKPVIYTIRPGYELVVGDHKLTRADLRPADGILRRNPQLVSDGYVGVSQYHLESALQQSAIVSRMNKGESDEKNRRVLADMSRMAAVLNQVNGHAGYAKE